MEITLVRHAQPAWVDDGRAVNDPGLTELGHRQAQATADRLAADHKPDEVLVSTARRSQETAAPISAALDPEPDTYGWLHEIRRPPEWDGSPIEQLRDVWISSRQRAREAWWDAIAPGGEPVRDFYRRVTDGLDDALAEWGVIRHADDPDNLWEVAEDTPRIIVVAHAGTNSVIISHLLGIPPQPWEWDRFWSGHASISRLVTASVAGGHIFSLRAFSDVAHLQPDDVTH